MLAKVPSAARRTIKLTVHTDSETSQPVIVRKSADRSDSEKPDWFEEMAQELLPKDAGLALHVLTGYEPRSCYRYAGGDRHPPADLLRRLIRRDDGEPFLNFVMDGVPWWLELQRAAAIGRKVLAMTREE